MFTNKCHLCKITEFNRIKDAQIIDKAIKYADYYLHIGCHHQTWAISRIVLNPRKRYLWKCFCKDCKIYFRTPYHDVHKQVPSLLNHKILQASRMPKSQSCKTTEFYDDQGCQNHKAVKYTDCNLQNACH